MMIKLLVSQSKVVIRAAAAPSVEKFPLSRWITDWIYSLSFACAFVITPVDS